MVMIVMTYDRLLGSEFVDVKNGDILTKPLLRSIF